MADRNQIKLQFHKIETSANDSFVVSILLQDAECPFGLDGSVHPQQSAVDALQIFQNLTVHRCQFLIEAYCTIPVGLLALSGIGTAAAVLALIDLFLPAIEIALKGLLH